ncbi:fungal-specific transcription factor domain-containing protein [Xylaria bambusicola]|uniref:fungal-specific transcription factor domain-containing protein n=1 Tax=Xylaria bambusicola TaxID=326684 RepID=UPI002007C4B7|nr:fungal-specific transcription factor domain-containing protein [Xylaria bambusicola]KAI0526254.1 fungal-specific transcription factor domain-containing protein [Xylaria bambusicola]
MTRPKVDPDKRQRTAQACDSCKRRKQKCNGEKPCNTCTKRHLDCQYTTSTLDHSGSQDTFGPPTKRRNIDSSPTMLQSPVEASQGITRRNSSLMSWSQATESGGTSLSETTILKPEHKLVGIGCQALGGVDGDFDRRSKLSNASGAADEAEVYHPQNRMLQDSTGRLLYIGDSATLSYLQWIRMIVENISGPSDFTVDPRRHMIMENAISLPQDLRPTGILPDQRTANILINSFFTNTAGFIEVFNKNIFLKSVDECYNDPLGVTPSLLCLLYLVFAIGLVMAAPYPGSDEAAVIDKLRDESASRAELFFRSAKSLADPVSGFEDADFWSIQALLLMSLYMLAVSKRNASYAYFGMAVRSAFALGLHREESMEVFQQEDRLVRRNLWRTLFILDRFLSACLGRPTAISEEDCSAFGTPDDFTPSPMGICTDATHFEALDATVKSCQVIGMTLKRVYSKRKISTAVGQEIVARLETWITELPRSLHWRRLVDERVDSNHGIAILHVNLLHCHSVMLLTRPFFLCLLNKAAVGLQGQNFKPSRPSHKMEAFAQTCVEASQHTLVLAQTVLDNKYLPQCNPFVIHCVFAAALIVLSNEFASLFNNPDARTSIGSAMSILRFCALNDKQADRVLYIVESFNKANEQRTSDNKRLYLPGRKIPILPTLSQNRNFDPMHHFFRLEQGETKSTNSTSAFNGDAVLVASAPPPIPLIPMIQPGPDEGVPMGCAITTASMPQGSDSLNGGDAEFDLNSIWDGWNNSSNTPAAVHQYHPGSFGSYSLGPSHIHPVGPSVMYHPSEFR